MGALDEAGFNLLLTMVFREWRVKGTVGKKRFATACGRMMGDPRREPQTLRATVNARHADSPA
jgi:hypothetical protein